MWYMGIECGIWFTGVIVECSVFWDEFSTVDRRLVYFVLLTIQGCSVKSWTVCDVLSRPSFSCTSGVPESVPATSPPTRTGPSTLFRCLDVHLCRLVSSPGMPLILRPYTGGPFSLPNELVRVTNPYLDLSTESLECVFNYDLTNMLMSNSSLSNFATTLRPVSDGNVCIRVVPWREMREVVRSGTPFLCT